jgi:hypothetical protein
MESKQKNKIGIVRWEVVKYVSERQGSTRAEVEHHIKRLLNVNVGGRVNYFSDDDPFMTRERKKCPISKRLRWVYTATQLGFETVKGPKPPSFKEMQLKAACKTHNADWATNAIEGEMLVLRRKTGWSSVYGWTYGTDQLCVVSIDSILLFVKWKTRTVVPFYGTDRLINTGQVVVLTPQGIPVYMSPENLRPLKPRKSVRPVPASPL